MYTKDQIIYEIRRIAASLGKKSLKKSDFQKHAKMSGSTVRYHFGTWNDAVKEAGFEPIDPIEAIRKRDPIPDDTLLIDLIRLYNEYGKNPLDQLSTLKANSVRDLTVPDGRASVRHF